MPWIPGFLGVGKNKNKLSPEYLSSLCTDVIKFSHNPEGGKKDCIVEVLKQISEILVWGDRHDPKIFDIFLERNVLPYMTELLCAKITQDVTVQLLQTLYIMISNIQSVTSVFYLLSGNHINKLIMFDGLNFEGDDEILSHFINFLKSLSLRLNAGTIQCFYNREDETFPLYTSTEKILQKELGNPLVKAAARAIVAHMCQVDDEYVVNFVIRNAEYIKRVFESVAGLSDRMDSHLTVFEESVNHSLHPSALPRPLAPPVSLSVVGSLLEDAQEDFSHLDDLLSLRDNAPLRYSVFEETIAYARQLRKVLRAAAPPLSSSSADADAAADAAAPAPAPGGGDAAAAAGADSPTAAPVRLVNPAVPRFAHYLFVAQWFYFAREDKQLIEILATVLAARDGDERLRTVAPPLDRPATPVKPTVKTFPQPAEPTPPPPQEEEAKEPEAFVPPPPLSPLPEGDLPPPPAGAETEAEAEQPSSASDAANADAEAAAALPVELGAATAAAAADDDDDGSADAAPASAAELAEAEAEAAETCTDVEVSVTDGAGDVASEAAAEVPPTSPFQDPYSDPCVHPSPPVSAVLHSFPDGWLAANIDTSSDEDPRTPQAVSVFIMAALESARMNRSDDLLPILGLRPRSAYPDDAEYPLLQPFDAAPASAAPDAPNAAAADAAAAAAALEVEGEESEDAADDLDEAAVPVLGDASKQSPGGGSGSVSPQRQAPLPAFFAHPTAERAPDVPRRSAEEEDEMAEEGWAERAQAGVDYPYATTELLLGYLSVLVRMLGAKGRACTVEAVCRALTGLLKPRGSGQPLKLAAHHMALLRDVYQVSCYNIRRRFDIIRASLAPHPNTQQMADAASGGSGGGGGGSLAVPNGSLVVGGYRLSNASIASNVSVAEGRPVQNPLEVLYLLLSSQVPAALRVRAMRPKELLTETVLLPLLPGPGAGQAAARWALREESRSSNPSFAAPGGSAGGGGGGSSRHLSSTAAAATSASSESPSPGATDATSASASLSPTSLATPKAAPVGEPGHYLVVGSSGAKVRKDERMSSRLVRTMPQFSTVEVVEVRQRRARLAGPQGGWVSMWSADGGVILERVMREGDRECGVGVGEPAGASGHAGTPEWLRRLPLEARCPISSRSDEELSQVEALTFLLVRSTLFGLLGREDTIATHLKLQEGEYANALGETASKAAFAESVRCQACAHPAPRLGTPPLATNDLLTSGVCLRIFF